MFIDVFAFTTKKTADNNSTNKKQSTTHRELYYELVEMASLSHDHVHYCGKVLLYIALSSL